MLAPQNTLLTTKGNFKINCEQKKNPNRLSGLDILVNPSHKLQVLH